MDGPNKIQFIPARFENEDACWRRVSEFARGLIEAGYEVSLAHGNGGIFVLQFDSELLGGEWKCVWEK